MPPKDWKLRVYRGALLEAAEWKRSWFARETYGTVQELVKAAAQGRYARWYVEAFMGLRERRERRRNLTDLYRAVTDGTDDHWSRGTLSALWLLYCTERNTWRRSTEEEGAHLVNSTRQQREVLRGAGLVRSFRRAPLAKRAQTMRDTAVSSIRAMTFMIWVDNYNKFRYSRNPNENRDKCINATVSAVMPVSDTPRHLWDGWMSPPEVLDRLQMFRRNMHTHHKQFNDNVRGLLELGLRWEHVRVPCDVRRFGVQSMPWRPLWVVPADIKSRVGLCQALDKVVGLQQETFGLGCLLMDVNIFWRVLKLAYGFHNLQYNVSGTLQDCVPVLGIWHCYAHCLKKVYERFLPWWAALEIPGFLEFPDCSVVYTRPRIIVLEHLVMGVFLAAGSIRA
jgi:hypothetical protein